MKALHIIAFVLLVIGGVNWGLVGAFDWNLVTAIFGGVPTLVSIIYILVGISAIYEAATHFSHCKVCSGDASMVR